MSLELILKAVEENNKIKSELIAKNKYYYNLFVENNHEEQYQYYTLDQRFHELADKSGDLTLEEKEEFKKIYHYLGNVDAKNELSHINSKFKEGTTVGELFEYFRFNQISIQVTVEGHKQPTVDVQHKLKMRRFSGDTVEEALLKAKNYIETYYQQLLLDVL